MTNKIFIPAVIIIAMNTLSSCNNNAATPPAAPPPVAVNTYDVSNGSAVYFDNYPATVTALNQTDIKAQVTGYITNVYFSDGQRVSKGQKLYDIDRLQYEATYNNAAANLNVMRSNLDRAQKDADRYNDLLKQDAIAKQVVDHALADLQSTKMQVAAASATVARAAADLKYATITAPFDGTIGISLVKPGTLVTANQTILNTVSSDDPVAVDIPLDQKDIPRFILLQKSNKNIDSTFRLQLPDNSTYDKPGSIGLIDRAIDPTTGTIKVRLIFPNTNGILKPGMNCNVQIKNNNPSTLFTLIPYKAVTEQMGEYFVFVVGDSSKVSQHKVLLGQRINDKVVVKDGVNVGDKIVTDGIQKLKEGSKVQIAPATPGK